MFWYYIERVMVTIATIVSVILVLILTIGMIEYLSGNSMGEKNETTTAKPIYQQQIGDDVKPDVLIIYEAEVDGVKVYPSVIKEAK